MNQESLSTQWMEGVGCGVLYIYEHQYRFGVCSSVLALPVSSPFPSRLQSLAILGKNWFKYIMLKSKAFLLCLLFQNSSPVLLSLETFKFFSIWFIQEGHSGWEKNELMTLGWGIRVNTHWFLGETQYILVILLQGSSFWRPSHFFSQWVLGLETCQGNFWAKNHHSFSF